MFVTTPVEDVPLVVVECAQPASVTITTLLRPPRLFKCERYLCNLLPRISGSDLDGMGTRHGTRTEEKLDAIFSKLCTQEAQLAQLPALTSWMSRMESHVTNSLGIFAARLTEMKQNFSALAARVCKFETGVNSTSNAPGSPGGSWPLDELMAARPRGPVTLAHLKKAGIQDGDTNLDDEITRSAVLLRFPCEQCHAGMSAWTKRALAQPICWTESTAIQELHQPDSCSKPEPNVRNLWHDLGMLASHIRSTVPFATS